MKTLFVALLFAVALPVLAEDIPWTAGYTNALAKAKKENKCVLLDFIGSDWCVPCKIMTAEVFSKPEFLSYAKTNLVMVEVDFPLKKIAKEIQDENDALQVKYNVGGYPTLVLLKPDGSEAWNYHGRVDGGPPAMIALLEKARCK